MSAASARLRNPFNHSPEESLRPLTGHEEELIESYQGSNASALCNELLARCLTEPGAPIDEALKRVRVMTVAERNSALMALRRITLGDVVRAEVSCPKCGTTDQVDFQLSDLPVEAPSGGQPIDTKLDDGTQVRLRLPTAGDQADLMDQELDTHSAQVSWLLSRIIERFGENLGPLDLDSARALPIGHRRQLEIALDERLPDIDLNMEVICVECSQEYTVPFEIVSFFLTK